MRFLVTGAAGFIGYHTSKALLERGDEVVGLDNLNDYYDVRLKEARLAHAAGPQRAFAFHKLDLADRAGMERLFRRDAAASGSSISPRRRACATRSRTRTPTSTPTSSGFLNILEGCRHNGVRAPRVCIVELGLRRQHRDAVLACTRTSTTR